MSSPLRAKRRMGYLLFLVHFVLPQFSSVIIPECTKNTLLEREIEFFFLVFVLEKNFFICISVEIISYFFQVESFLEFNS